ncbi:hypothetical protein ACROYT_G019630 [Oculina patagonica]
MTAILYYIAALLCVVTVNEACRCAEVHPQTNFCNADFAIRAKVLSESQDNNTRIYKLKILKTYKGATEIAKVAASQVKSTEKRTKKNKVAHATTELDSAACGVGLDRSKIYLLLGYIEGKKLTIDSCQWHPLWTKTTAQQRRGLKKLYGRNCACRIGKYCFKRPTETCDDMIDGCDVPDTDYRVIYCKRGTAYCKKMGDECKWIIAKKSFQKCFENGV